MNKGSHEKTVEVGSGTIKHTYYLCHTYYIHTYITASDFHCFLISIYLAYVNLYRNMYSIYRSKLGL
jgi:hypothetical protein